MLELIEITNILEQMKKFAELKNRTFLIFIPLFFSSLRSKSEVIQLS